MMNPETIAALARQLHVDYGPMGAVSFRFV
jgi:hypothetical protein